MFQNHEIVNFIFINWLLIYLINLYYSLVCSYKSYDLLGWGRVYDNNLKKWILFGNGFLES